RSCARRSPRRGSDAILVGGRLDPRDGRVRADRRSNARRLAQMLTPFPIFIAAGAFETTDCLILKR
ncbi:MAG: hypothetical protein WCA06_01660, partial [Terrimicrobiaceae bacterium]